MNTENYDQVTLPADLVGDQAAYLQPEMKVTLAVYEGVPVSIELPQKATLEVVETEPAVKGQTAASSYKPAVLSNGVRTMVPPFVGDRHQDRGDDRRRLLRRARQGLITDNGLWFGPRRF